MKKYMEPKLLVPFVIALLVVGSSSFYAGMRYARASRADAFANGAFQGGPGGQRGGAARGNFARGTGFASGAILSKDDTSLTLKMMDGSTKIVLFATSTEVLKSAAGSLADLAAGTEVTVMGTGNTDGSLTAKSIQLRGAGSPAIPR